MNRPEDILRIIETALLQAREVIRPFTPGDVAYDFKSGDDPVTQADLAADRALKSILPQDGFGWLSEETTDDRARLDNSLVWVVDPLDGTREFVQGIPEWCISIGLVENGRAVAGGILNPVTEQLILGGMGQGVRLNGEPVRVREPSSAENLEVLASNSEVKRGEWERFRNEPIRVRPMGSVAYKLGLVAAGLADLTWTPVPKHEWDVAAGVALIEAGGGRTMHRDGSRPRFNNEHPLFPDLLGCPGSLAQEIHERWFSGHVV